MEIAESGLDDEATGGTLHLAGPPEFTSVRVLPALAPLVEQGMALRAVFAPAEESLEGLAAGHHDLALTTTRPHGKLLTTTPLGDEEHILVAGPRWAARLGGPDDVRAKGPRLLEGVPVVAVHESMPLVTRYWTTVFDAEPVSSGALIAPDFRAVLDSVAAGAGMAVLPRYLCAEALDRGRVVGLMDPPVPPLRTYFLSVRAGTLARPHIARAHESLLRAAVHW